MRFSVEDIQGLQDYLNANGLPDELISGKNFIELFYGDCDVISLGDLDNTQFVENQGSSGSSAITGGDAPYSIVSTVGLPTGLDVSIQGTNVVFTENGLSQYGPFNVTVNIKDANECPGSRVFSIFCLQEEIYLYRSRVQSAGSDITGTLLTKYMNLYDSIRSAGLRSKIVRLNLFKADTFAGIFEPLFNSVDAVSVIGDISDTNNNFVSGDWTTDGLKGNGSTKYTQTGVIPDMVAEIAQDNIGLMVWVTEMPAAGTTYDIGALPTYLVADNGGDLLIGISSAGNSPGITPELGFLWAGRQNASDIDITLNNSNYTVAQASLSEPAVEILGFAVNVGSPFGHVARRHRLQGITQWLTTTERAALKTAFENFIA